MSVFGAATVYLAVVVVDQPVSPSRDCDYNPWKWLVSNLFPDSAYKLSDVALVIQGTIVSEPHAFHDIAEENETLPPHENIDQQRLLGRQMGTPVGSNRPNSWPGRLDGH